MSEKSIVNLPYGYCPGCGHASVHTAIGKVIDKLGIREKTVAVAPVGCAVTAYKYFNFDTCEAAHGRAAAVATGLRRALPDNIVFSYQGDGDLAAIGLTETIHAANRGENITVIFINNAIYGMTGGQMAPTTTVGQKTTTTSKGRDSADAGYPIDVSKMLSTLRAPVLVARTKVTDGKSVLETQNLIEKAFRLQMDKKGYTFIEVLSNCNMNWKMDVKEANKWIDEVMEKEFPLGVFIDKYGVCS